VLFATVCLTIGTNKIIKTLSPIQNNQMKRSKYQLTTVAPIVEEAMYSFAYSSDNTSNKIRVLSMLIMITSTLIVDKNKYSLLSLPCSTKSLRTGAF
jgi:hypothetical protein